ncbi:GNAT family N-acetyltransferase [Amylibacter sp. SFDW26]|uniref:GNAT family N-acetyltransferase n=1 Tax=Amylibacter sp. SFDW26 TaxID=2652722 RepID=UPI00126148B6|nr:GNAT family N-acetyltransferase [Amylibacter sp. SFDW26]KAB7613709.1 GNAT family N-acetyltransferase [Amylibacter sp. SFDW26]
MVKIRVIDATETLFIRQKVLWPDLSIEDCILKNDADGIHIGAFDQGTLIAVASVFEGQGHYRLRKFAVVPEKQGGGVGSDILRYIFNMLTHNTSKTLWLDARITALPFYEKCGFEQTGATFLKGDVHYIKMYRALTILP